MRVFRIETFVDEEGLRGLLQEEFARYLLPTFEEFEAMLPQDRPATVTIGANPNTVASYMMQGFMAHIHRNKVFDDLLKEYVQNAMHDVRTAMHETYEEYVQECEGAHAFDKKMFEKLVELLKGGESGHDE